jgi:hypothetical protein
MCLFLVAGAAAAQDIADADPLFASNGVVHVTIAAPIKQLMKDRPLDEYFSGTFSYQDEAGQLVEFDVGLRTRGKYRRKVETCRFAPLRINFKKSQTKDTLFDKQDKLKLVTHCRNDSATYEQAVIAEYLAYRIYNTLTDISFRARLLKVRYVDTDESGEEDVSYGILVEDEDRLAKRIGVPRAQVAKLVGSNLDPDYSALGTLFQYFIGNTDFSQVETAPGENCCHNHELFAHEGEKYLAVPYDFDMTGFVNAPHARPNPRFGLRSVRQRLYRGRCIHNDQLDGAAKLFLDKRGAIEALVETEAHLSDSVRKHQLRYIKSFYKEIESPRARQKYLIDKCI